MNIKQSIFDKENGFSSDEKALKEFKKLIKGQGIKCCMDDIFLLGFLRARKSELSRSLQLLKNYYDVRVQYPEYFQNLLPSRVEHALSLKTSQFLPKPDKKGRFIYIFQFGNWDTSVSNMIDLLRFTMLIMDLQLNLHRTQTNSIIIVVNAAGISLSHFLQMTPRFISSVANILFKDAYQMRYSEIHYVNVNVIVKAFLSVLLPLLPAKLKERFHFHTDVASLHEFISPDCLPAEYGGILPSFDPTEYNDMVKANEDFFQKNEEYLKIYEEERNKNFTQGKFRYIGEDEDEKVKKFIEKSEERFKSYSEDPEAFIEAMKKDSEFEITHF